MDRTANCAYQVSSFDEHMGTDLVILNMKIDKACIKYFNNNYTEKLFFLFHDVLSCSLIKKTYKLINYNLLFRLYLRRPI